MPGLERGRTTCGFEPEGTSPSPGRALKNVKYRVSTSRVSAMGVYRFSVFSATLQPACGCSDTRSTGAAQLYRRSRACRGSWCTASGAAAASWRRLPAPSSDMLRLEADGFRSYTGVPASCWPEEEVGSLAAGESASFCRHMPKSTGRPLGSPYPAGENEPVTVAGACW